VGEVFAIDELYTQLEWAEDVTVCLPLTEETRGIFGADAFKAMRAGATFINVGRGQLVDEEALVGALQSGHLGAAGLDVFEEEPLPPDSPLWDFENVVVSPHMSGDEIGWRAALTRQFARNLARWRAGEPLQNAVHGQQPEPPS
jgi:phosphoglycerate dehydrogenase-like enzyme